MAKKSSSSPPEFLPIWGIPNVSNLPTIYNTYMPKQSTLKCWKTERRRKTFAEVLTYPFALGPLQDLCIRAMAKKYAPKNMLLSILQDPLKSRIYYDTLSVDLPLKDVIDIDDEGYWRRVVIAKSKNKGMMLKKEPMDWKCMAVSVMLAEMLENCPAEYLHEDELEALAAKIKFYLTDLHIRSLRSLNDTSFALGYVTESDSDNDKTSSDDEVYSSSDMPLGTTHEEEEWQIEERGRRAARIQERRSLREDRRNRRRRRSKHKEERRQTQLENEAAAAAPPRKPSIRTTKSSPKKYITKVERKKKLDERILRKFDKDFAIPVEPVEFENIMDTCNLEEYFYDKTRRNKYPVNQCHHIPMGFLRFFDNLVSFTIEFTAPELGRHYHSKHFNFSLMDILQLSAGIVHLSKLRIFRLRKSRMSAKKLHQLAKALVKLPLEVVDFGYDQLREDCEEAIDLLFQISTLKTIELESNPFSTKVMKSIAAGIHSFKGKLEYLGLARNSIEVKEMHTLCKAMVGNDQVTHLNLTGASISQKTIAVCISRELLRFSEVLMELDLTAVRIETRAGRELVSALRDNYKIMECSVRGSGVEADVERDINVICMRNRYIARNPYVRNVLHSKDQIDSFLSGQRNPIFKRALRNARKATECYDNHVRHLSTEASMEAETDLPLLKVHSTLREALTDSISDYRRLLPTVAFSSEHASKRPAAVVTMHLPGIKSATTLDEEQPFLSHSRSYLRSSSVKCDEPFHIDPNNFDEKLFYQHVFQPGREDHFYYLEAKAQNPHT